MYRYSRKKMIWRKIKQISIKTFDIIQRVLHNSAYKSIYWHRRDGDGDGRTWNAIRNFHCIIRKFIWQCIIDRKIILNFSMQLKVLNYFKTLVTNSWMTNLPFIFLVTNGQSTLIVRTNSSHECPIDIFTTILFLVHIFIQFLFCLKSKLIYYVIFCFVFFYKNKVK